MNQRIGKYEILEQLGSGGMAVAYKARDTLLGRTVALKVIHEKLAISDSAGTRFLNEAQIAAGLTHPNIVTIHELGVEKGRPFIAMEYLPGQDLCDLVQEQTLDLTRKVRIALQIALALQHAHANGVIHRDVKPPNIRILPGDFVKLMDFGIARMTSPDATRLTEEGVIIGTLAYMSPEQIQGRPLGPPSDIFSFGIVLYELLTNIRPFQGSTTTALLYSILTVDPPPIESAEVSEPLRRLVEGCLEKSSERRFASFDPIIETLSQIERRPFWSELPTEREVPLNLPALQRHDAMRSPTGGHRAGAAEPNGAELGDGHQQRAVGGAGDRNGEKARATTARRARRKLVARPQPDGAGLPKPGRKNSTSKRPNPKARKARLLVGAVLLTTGLVASASVLLLAVGFGWFEPVQREPEVPSVLANATPSLPDSAGEASTTPIAELPAQVGSTVPSNTPASSLPVAADTPAPLTPTPQVPVGTETPTAQSQTPSLPATDTPASSTPTPNLPAGADTPTAQTQTPSLPVGADTPASSTPTPNLPSVAVPPILATTPNIETTVAAGVSQPSMSPTPELPAAAPAEHPSRTPALNPPAPARSSKRTRTPASSPSTPRATPRRPSPTALSPSPTPPIDSPAPPPATPATGPAQSLSIPISQAPAAGTVAMRPIKWGKRGRELKIEARVQADSIAKVVLHYRLSTDGAIRTILMENSSGSIYRATIDAKQISGRVFYSIEATDRSGQVFGLGSKETPLPLMIPQAKAAERVDVPVSF